LEPAAGGNGQEGNRAICGIAGAIDRLAPLRPEAALAALARLTHRGPDDEDQWRADGVWLGHRRLSVVDLSIAGRQPMASACGRYMLVFNGEIYNHRALRAELDAARPGRWRGSSDTEVLVEAISAWGVEAATRKLNGMFAFAVWDAAERRTTLARDPFGEKPLYYTTLGGRLAFASELSALEPLAAGSLSLSRKALWLYFKYGYVPAPHTIYEDVFKVAPGVLLSWSEDGAPPRETPYWSFEDTIAQSRRDPLDDPHAAADALERLLLDAVSLRMVADAPLGAFLSGGVDSSLVTALMQARSPRPVKTFTAGFECPQFNEAEHAGAVAAHLGTEHTQCVVTMADAAAVVPQLGRIFDEPFADASQIPTFLISRMARSRVTVCLTGDGGDEMFGGYVRYPGVPRLWKGLSKLPMRWALAAAMNGAPPALLEGVFGRLGPAVKQFGGKGALGLNLKRAAAWTPATCLEDLYDRTMSAWTRPDQVLAGPANGRPGVRQAPPPFDDPIDGLIWRDTIDYLPGDILCKVDRAAMANSLETRVPLLDTRIAAFAWRLPMSMRIRDGQGKWLLRQVLDRYVPRALVDRPKMGFNAPLHRWLTGELKPWASDLLSPAALRRDGLLRPGAVETLWRRYQNGDTSVEHRLWTVLMLRAWQAGRA
jgi:asparagine synthase (glutamine-hydrolysing)